MVNGRADWAGVSFRAVNYRDGRMFRAPGLFAFVRYDPAGGPLMLLAGQAEDLAQEAGPRHGSWAPALELGMNELHISLPITLRIDRLQLLARIVRHVQPVLNLIDEAHRSPASTARQAS